MESMAKNAIEAILEKRRQENAGVVATPSLEPAPSTSVEERQEDQFFSILVTAGLEENFIEFRFRDGLCICLPYSSIIWFDYQPDDGINLDFGSCLMTIRGRGLKPKLFNAIKQKRLAWVKEADLEFQDHKDNVTYIEEIEITTPEGAGGEETA